MRSWPCWRISLAYDVVFFTLTVILAAWADGWLRGVAVTLAFSTVVKAPYDIWVCRRVAPDVQAP